LVFVHHTGGLTRRPLEISFQGFKIEIIDDFQEHQKSMKDLSNSNKAYIKHEILSLFKKLIRISSLSLGFLSTMNSNTELSALNYWVLQVRGHYTQLNIPLENLKSIKETILNSSGKSPAPENLSTSISAHIRLGDLVALKPEALTNFDLLKTKMAVMQKVETLNVFSDSSEVELNGFLDHQFTRNYITETNPANVIIWCSRSKSFIGTNSKISFWITAMRVLDMFEGEASIPKNIFVWLMSTIQVPDVYQSKIISYPE
jgi:hypothetical protein